MRAYDIIRKKRDGEKLSKDEIEFMIAGLLSGNVPEYQISAWLMTIYFKGMSKREIYDLTQLMVESGETISFSSISGPLIDKHSSGGVGDKTSLILGPLVAAGGLKIAKMSGRGLGHTGGTIDKLEAIPGFRTDLSRKQLIDQVNQIGIAITGQTGNIATADKELYALRDVTATVNHPALIASSIMSKKLAFQAEGLILDVKCGNGAFIRNSEEAIELAKMMVELGWKNKRATVAFITDMSQPLGNKVGNALEAIESIEVLRGEGPKDLKELVLKLGSEMIVMGRIKENENEGEKLLGHLIHSGEAVDKLKHWIEFQGGDKGVVDNFEKFPKSGLSKEIIAERSGYLKSCSASIIGHTAMLLGAGRAKKGDKLDLGAGIILGKKTGDYAQKGETLATLYASDGSKLEMGTSRVYEAFEFSEEPVDPPKLMIAKVTREGVEYL